MVVALLAASARAQQSLDELVAKLLRTPEPRSETAAAIRRAGGAGVCALVGPLARTEAIGSDYEWCVDFILSELDERAAPAIDPLVRIACTRHYALANRQAAVRGIGHVGISARRATPALRALADFEPEGFAELVERALVDIGGPEGIEILLARLRADPDSRDLERLAAIGESAQDATPIVLTLLDHEDEDVRVAAVTALGSVGGAAHASVLARKLESDDWQIVQAACYALARVRSKDSVPALQRVGETHWFPRVRHVAEKAAAVARGEGAFDDAWEEAEWARRVGEYNAQREPAPQLPRGPEELSETELQEFVYEYEFHTRDKDGRPSTQLRKQAPRCGVRVPGGALVGASRGEWGGELVYVRRNGEAVRVKSENVTAIHVTPSGIVLVAGIAHMGWNEGQLYRLAVGDDGHWRATWWKRLPGAPAASGFLPDGSLFLRCCFADVRLTPSGDLAAVDAR